LYYKFVLLHSPKEHLEQSHDPEMHPPFPVKFYIDIQQITTIIHLFFKKHSFLS